MSSVEKQSRDLQEKVFSDALTGLLNRFSYDQAILRFQKEKLHSFSCVYLDVNGLHEINNRLGHEAAMPCSKRWRRCSFGISAQRTCPHRRG